MKVKVNKEVADIFEKAKQRKPRNVIEFMNAIHLVLEDSFNWQVRYKITDADLINAYVNGWTTYKEFKNGDVISYRHFKTMNKPNAAIISCVSGGTNFILDNGAVINEESSEIELICRKQNREDLKLKV